MKLERQGEKERREDSREEDSRTEGRWEGA